MLAVNTPAPDFTIPDQDGTPVALRDFRGQTVVLAFHPKDDSLMCTRQLNDYASHYADFSARGARIFAISPDSVEHHRSFHFKSAFPFPLLPDRDTAVSRAYKALNILGMAKRAVCIIDRDGVIRFTDSTFSVTYLDAEDILGGLSA
jgi:thioredoxin-dependent peroxiredoxin